VLEGRGQFESAAAYVRLILAEQPDRGILRDRSPGLVDLLLADQNATGKNQCASALAAGDEAPLDEQQVETSLSRACFARIRAWPPATPSQIEGPFPQREWPFGL
jgi:hypothetical protein